ncbi:unnamed protein product [Cylindrotheca closterium]|uniref:Uncharacterized protein n=1 Tax=Cylindrotheca closterium TaxID=2856 RepID=A0AAD2CRW0_9STRA|nr:unnamed protein product [Cylindrotheca closterium]
MPEDDYHVKSISHQKDFAGLIAPPVVLMPPDQRSKADCTKGRRSSPVVSTLSLDSMTLVSSTKQKHKAKNSLLESDEDEDTEDDDPNDRESIVDDAMEEDEDDERGKPLGRTRMMRPWTTIYR